MLLISVNDLETEVALEVTTKLVLTVLEDHITDTELPIHGYEHGL
jgi:hypothetical protein